MFAIIIGLIVIALVVTLLMYLGRVGSISFAMALLERRTDPPVTYPEEQVTVG